MPKIRTVKTAGTRHGEVLEVFLSCSWAADLQGKKKENCRKNLVPGDKNSSLFSRLFDRRRGAGEGRKGKGQRSAETEEISTHRVGGGVKYFT